MYGVILEFYLRIYTLIEYNVFILFIYLLFAVPETLGVTSPVD